MRIQQNTDVQINPLQNQDNAQIANGKVANKSGNLSSISGANLKGESLVQQSRAWPESRH